MKGETALGEYNFLRKALFGTVVEEKAMDRIVP
jgi:hypothetical protein